MIANIFSVTKTKLSYLVLPLATVFFLSASFAQSKNQSDFTARLVNIEATAKETFRFNTTLKNESGQEQVYALKAEVPQGWNTVFKTDGVQVSAVKIESGKAKEITLELLASPIVTPGKYTVPVTATSKDTLSLQLEAVVKGSYNIELTTPTGRLSDDITEGKSKVLKLVVKNTGTLPLDNLELSSQSPSKWTSTFHPAKLERLEVGATQELDVTLQVPDKTIAGDYVATYTAKNSHVNANTTFRITVKTSLLSGWLGIAIILLSLGIVYYLIKKYGRR